MIDTVEKDMHILRYFSSFISVSGGRVINITEPKLTSCPLAEHLYQGFQRVNNTDKEAVKREIKEAIESKIRDCGLFTAKRVLFADKIAIPYGASEMLMFALKKRVVDAAVIVCDGAGTVITDNGEVAQGIGARMNSLLFTSPISATIGRLRKFGCRVVFENALIDQVKGVEKAIESGYKRIAVTVSGHDADNLKEIRRLGSSDTVITILVVCTTGISAAKIEQARQYADLVWSCASQEVRRKIGSMALLQISKAIPVFVLTQRGIDFIAAYAQDEAPLRELDEGRQYLVSNEPGERKIKLGNMLSYLRQAKLPDGIMAVRH